MLFVPHGGRSFGKLLTSYTEATRPIAAMGTTITPGTNVYGTAVQMGVDLTEDAHGVHICITNNFASAASRGTAVKLSIDPAGGATPTQDMITGLLCGGAGSYLVNRSIWYYFPIFIKSGSSVFLSANGTVTTAITAFTVLEQQFQEPMLWHAGSFVQAIGLGANGNIGTAIVPGTTADGVWTSMGTTTYETHHLEFGFQVATGDTNWGANTHHIDVAFGDVTNKNIVIQDALVYQDGGEFIHKPSTAWNYANSQRAIPAGTTIYMRAQASGTIDTYTAAVYALGG